MEVDATKLIDSDGWRLSQIRGAIVNIDSADGGPITGMFR